MYNLALAQLVNSWVKVLAAKPDGLSSAPRTDERTNPCKLSPGFPMCIMAGRGLHVHTHTHMLTHTQHNHNKVVVKWDSFL